MPHSIQEWHQRYVFQTRWTRTIANHVFQQLQLPTSASVLEVGCGTGAAIQEILLPRNLSIFGVDINPDYLHYAKVNLPKPRLILADGHHLPIADNSYDLCFCHFLLLWVTNPIQSIIEMVRVTRPGGAVITLAEPDYGSRIDFPTELAVLGKWQMESLLQQGANPTLGRQLRALLSASGLKDVKAGLLGGEWNSKNEPGEFESEWDTLRSDFHNDPEISSQLSILREVDSTARDRGARILFVPTFYAWGFVA